MEENKCNVCGKICEECFDSNIKFQLESLNLNDFKGKVLVVRVNLKYSQQEIKNLFNTIDSLIRDMKLDIPILILPEDISVAKLSLEDVEKILKTVGKK